MLQIDRIYIEIFSRDVCNHTRASRSMLSPLGCVLWQIALQM
jgi:hypothetical protein